MPDSTSSNSACAAVDALHQSIRMSAAVMFALGGACLMGGPLLTWMIGNPLCLAGSLFFVPAFMPAYGNMMYNVNVKMLRAECHSTTDPRALARDRQPTPAQAEAFSSRGFILAPSRLLDAVIRLSQAIKPDVGAK
jgi:hypothetical protein